MLVLAGVLVCCVIGGVWLAAGRAALARQRAETAADLAALAGAQSLTGHGRAAAPPCAAAGRAAAANGGRLLECSVAGDEVTVAVAVGRPMPARAVARAGPRGAQ